MMRRILTTLALIGATIAVVDGALAASTPERIVFDGNVLWKNSQDGTTPLPWASGSGPCTTSVAITYTTTDLGTSFFTHNRTNIDPMLVDPFNQTNPRFDPTITSPVRCKYQGGAVVLNVTSLDPFFQQVDYVGAVPARIADPASDWTTGWTLVNRSASISFGMERCQTGR